MDQSASSINVQKDSDVKNLKMRDSINIRTEDNVRLQKSRENLRYNRSPVEKLNSSRPNLTRELSGPTKPRPKLVPLDDLDLLSNPKKTHTDSDRGSTDYDSDYLSDEEEMVENKHTYNNLFEESEQPRMESPYQRSYASSMDGSSLGSSLASTYSESEEEEPQKTYEEIQREKQDLLFKLDRLEKSMGVKLSRRFTMASNIEDIKYEYQKLKKNRDVEKSIRFQRKALMACVSGIEFLNGKFDPVDVKLDGWSESVMENVNDYDEVFEELHDKYSEKISVAPELKLLMMVGGSAFMFHLTQTLFKSSVPGLNDILRQNPDIMRNIAQAAANNMNQNFNAGGGQGNDPVVNMMMNGMNMSNQNRQRSQPPPTPTHTQRGGREMRPPQGVDDILNQLNTGNRTFSSTGMASASESEDDMPRMKVNNRRPRSNRRPGINIDV